MADTDNTVGNDEAVTPEETQEPAEAPLNRAQRRAMASGKKGSGGNAGLANQGNVGGAGGRGSTPAGQRIQTRGAQRGK